MRIGSNGTGVKTQRSSHEAVSIRLAAARGVQKYQDTYGRLQANGRTQQAYLFRSVLGCSLSPPSCECSSPPVSGERTAEAVDGGGFEKRPLYLGLVSAKRFLTM